MLSDMAQQKAVRLPDELIQKIEAHAETLRGAQPGLKVTFTDAVRVLILRGLEVPQPGDVLAVPVPRAGRRGRR